MTAVNRYQQSTNILQKAFKLGLYAGLAVGTILGVPPFIAAIGDLLGGTVNQIDSIVSNSPLLADITKYLSMGFWALGGYALYQSSLPAFKKYVGIGLCAVVLVNLYSITSSNLASYIIGSLIPMIGFTIWGVVNAAQIFMLTLRNNPEAVKKLLSRIGKNPEPNTSPDDSATAIELKTYLSKNKVASALSFIMFCGTAGYVVEFAVNILYSSNSVNWMLILQPGGIVNLGWNLLTSIVVLLFTIGSIEFFVISLQNLDEIKDAVN